MCGRLFIHAGGCIEFADEIERLANDIPHDVAGCVWIPGISTTPEWIRSPGWIAITRGSTTCTSGMWIRRFTSAPSPKASTFHRLRRRVMCPLGSGAIDYPAINDFLPAAAIRAG